MCWVCRRRSGTRPRRCATPTRARTSRTGRHTKQLPHLVGVDHHIKQCYSQPPSGALNIEHLRLPYVLSTDPPSQWKPSNPCAGLAPIAPLYPRYPLLLNASRPPCCSGCRALSIKSTPVSLVLEATRGKSYLMNLVDTPGMVSTPSCQKSTHPQPSSLPSRSFPSCSGSYVETCGNAFCSGTSPPLCLATSPVALLQANRTTDPLPLSSLFPSG